MEFKSVQLNYFDTPGLEQRKGGFKSSHWGIINEVDFALVVLDSNKRFDDNIKVTIERLDARRKDEESPMLKALVLNKIDLMTSKSRFSSLISQIERHGKFDRIFYTSAETDYGIKDLEDYLVSMAPKDEWKYPP